MPASATARPPTWQLPLLWCALALSIMRDLLRSLLCGFGAERINVRGETYKVVRPVADGGFSQVLAVRAPRSSDLLAVKRIILQSDDQVREAQWEIRVHDLVGNANPNCVALLAREITPSRRGRRQALLVFPLFERGSLVDHLLLLAQSGREMPEADALAFLSQICNGVAAFHALQPALAHRDIKPHNVLLAGDGTPVLMDFGSAAVARVDTSSRQARLSLQDHAARHCSMAYRAPELWEPTDDPTCIVDERTDVWSLGCLLFAMLFGQGFSPFECKFLHNTNATNANPGPFARAAAEPAPSGPARAVPKECTYLSVIGNLPLPPSHARSPATLELIQWMLTVTPSQRPTLDQVMRRLPSVQQSLHQLNIV